MGLAADVFFLVCCNEQINTLCFSFGVFNYEYKHSVLFSSDGFENGELTIKNS